MKAEVSLWTSPPLQECEFKNYSRKPAWFDENGVLVTDVDFDSAGKGTQVHITHTMVHLATGKSEMCELTTHLYLFKGVSPRFARGSIQLGPKMVHEIRENLPKIVPDQEYLPGFEP